MNFKISKNNPFKEKINVPHAFVWEKIASLYADKGKIKILDYGAYDGRLLDRLSDSNFIYDSTSIELNLDVVNTNKYLKNANNELLHIQKHTNLPFEDKTFDVVLLIGVIEHIHNQKKILDELNRILKNDGHFIVAVPGKHIFSFLDFGNWKFIFPRLHKIYVELVHGKELYKERFVDCKNGLIGDIEIEKKWHEHFSHSSLEALLNKSNFTIDEKDGFGLFFRVIHNLKYVIPLGKSFFDKLIVLDGKIFSKAEIFVLAHKSN
jgi:SAM-dependent methyltransferase